MVLPSNEVGNLGQQRRLLESRTAYLGARLVVNAAFGLIGAAGVVGGVLWAKLFHGLGVGGAGVAPEQMVFLRWTGGILCGLAYAAGLYVVWAAVQALFDMADACLVMSLRRGEKDVLAGESRPVPRAARG